MKPKSLPFAYLILSASLLALHATSVFAQNGSIDPRANETKAQRDARMKWWREARFGMFIHWGSYAVAAGIYDGKPIPDAGEWIQHTAHIPVSIYSQYAKRFDPEQFDANRWVSIAKGAGMKYIVMTAKHHEGFAMFPSKVDDYNLNAQSRFKRDPIGEMTEACRKAGIKFGVYYSQNLDWHHPGGGTAGAAWDEAQKGDFHEYVRKISAPQVKELLTRYRPAVLWWDINGPFTPEEVRLLTASFAADPGLISNNRLGGGVPGDTETPEQFIPATGFKGRDWEVCMTMNDTWGYKSTDTNFKSVPTLLHNLIDIASKGGNYLLNVGPTAQGIIPEPEVARLQAMGEWMRANGGSIYDTTASPYKKLPFDGRATIRRNTLFLNVFSWPDSGLVLAGLQTPVRSARVVDGGQRLKVRRSADGTLSISKPAKLNPYSTAIALELAGAPVVVEPEALIGPDKDGAIALRAAAAQLEGDTIQAAGGDSPNIGYWINAKDSVSWKVKAIVSGVYRATLEFSCEPGTEGSTFVLRVDGKDSGVRGSVAKTGGWQDYTTVELPGTLSLPAGRHTIQVAVTNKPGYAVMNLRRIVLSPVH